MTTALDLRHIISHPNLTASHRLSQHLRTSPARSPTSIPSSPTSVHSSSSAIFERDIEPLAPPSPQHFSPHYPPDPHRIPRSRTTEQIEHSVPSVLDSAAAILASVSVQPAGLAPADVAVVAPAPRTAAAYSPYSHFSPGSGFASPIGSFGGASRSPSPPTVGAAVVPAHARTGSLLLSTIPHVHTRSGSPPPPMPPPPSAVAPPPQTQHPWMKPTPTIQTSTVSVASTAGTAPPSIVTPTSAYFSVADEPEGDAETSSASAYSDEVASTASDHHLPVIQPQSHSSMPQISSPTTTATTTTAISASPKPFLSGALPPSSPLSPASPGSSAYSHSPHSPLTPASPLTKRLSFISYADLITSTPTSTFPLSSLTTAASAIEPPPHIPSVSGMNYTYNYHLTPSSPGTSLHGFALSAPAAAAAVHVQHAHVGGQHSPKRRDSMSVVASEVDDLSGGEWEREGLGRGLEERLDVLYGMSPVLTGTGTGVAAVMG